MSSYRRVFDFNEDLKNADLNKVRELNREKFEELQIIKEHPLDPLFLNYQNVAVPYDVFFMHIMQLPGEHTCAKYLNTFFGRHLDIVRKAFLEKKIDSKHVSTLFEKYSIYPYADGVSEYALEPTNWENVTLDDFMSLSGNTYVNIVFRKDAAIDSKHIVWTGKLSAYDDLDISLYILNSVYKAYMFAGQLFHEGPDLYFSKVEGASDVYSMLPESTLEHYHCIYYNYSSGKMKCYTNIPNNVKLAVDSSIQEHTLEYKKDVIRNNFNKGKDIKNIIFYTRRAMTPKIIVKVVLILNALLKYRNYDTGVIHYISENVTDYLEEFIEIVTDIPRAQQPWHNI